MRNDRPSLSARGVALARAALDRPSTPEGDADADGALARSLGLNLRPPRGLLFEYLAARTAFFDDVVLNAIWAGCRQVVVVGAGYDGRALRFRTPGVRFFELDHPATQADKRARLVAVGADVADIVFAPVDFTTGAAGDVLDASGHDATLDTLFLCEGVMLYLNRSVIVGLLESLGARASAASVLAVNFPIRQETRDSVWLRRRALRLLLALAGEPTRTELSQRDALELLRSTGWVSRRVSDPADVNPRVRRGQALLVEATPVDVTGPTRGSQDRAR